MVLTPKVLKGKGFAPHCGATAPASPGMDSPAPVGSSEPGQGAVVAD